MTTQNSDRKATLSVTPCRVFQVHFSGGGRHGAVHQRHGWHQEGGAAPGGVDSAGGTGGTGPGAAPRTPASRRKASLTSFKSERETVLLTDEFSVKSLPPANEVWGKVMFSQVSVRGEGGLCMMSIPVWLTGPMFLLEVSLLRGYLSRGIFVYGVSGGGRRFVQRRDSVQGSPWTETPLPCTVTSGLYASHWNAFLF